MAQSTSNIFTVNIKTKDSSKTLPAWVPPAGYFADVPMLNNPADVRPSIYTASNTMDDPFVIWGGSAILQDYSPLGAQVYYSGGHESSGGLPNTQMSLICDFSTLTWSVKNLPIAANAANTFDANGYAPDGTAYTPHSYLGLQEFPAAWGGGSKGSLASFFWAGSSVPNRINLLDVSKPINGYSQLQTKQAQNAQPTRISFSANGGRSGGSYPITVIDRKRQGWWAHTIGTIDYTLFISKAGEITQYPSVMGNSGYASMVLCDSLDLLIVVDGGSATAGQKMWIRDLVNGPNTSVAVNMLGTIPSYQNLASYDVYRPEQMGLQWVEELGCIVGLDQRTVPLSVVKLTPPASNAATTGWTWSTVPVQHWTAGDMDGQVTLQTVQNATWSKFSWVPALHAFVYGTGKDRKPQIIRLA